MNSILIWLQLLDSHGITSLCHILPKSVTYVMVLFCNLSHGDVPYSESDFYVACTRAMFSLIILPATEAGYREVKDLVTRSQAD